MAEQNSQAQTPRPEDHEWREARVGLGLQTGHERIYRGARIHLTSHVEGAPAQIRAVLSCPPERLPHLKVALEAAVDAALDGK